MILAQSSPASSWHETVTFCIAVFGAGLGLYNAWNAKRARRAQYRQEAPYFVHPEILILYRGQISDPGSFTYAPDYKAVPETYEDGGAVLFRMTNKGGEARLADVTILSDLPAPHAEYRVLNDGAPSICFTDTRRNVAGTPSGSGSPTKP